MPTSRNRCDGLVIQLPIRVSGRCVGGLEELWARYVNWYGRYVEAAHILYSTSTFHSANRHMVYNLDVLFPSHRLAQIPGLEITHHLPFSHQTTMTWQRWNLGSVNWMLSFPKLRTPSIHSAIYISALTSSCLHSPDNQDATSWIIV